MRSSVLLALALAAAAAPAAHATLPTCAALHGRDIAPSPAARIVEAPLGHGRSHLLGCAPPHGAVRALTPPLANHQSLGGGVLRDAVADVEALRGAIAAVWVYDSRGTGDGYETDRASRRVWNLRTGRSYLTWSFAHGPDDDVEDREYDLGDTKRTLLDGHGRAVIAYVNVTTRMTAVAAFSADGRRTVLERAVRGALPVASLRLAGEKATWTVGGEDHTTDLTDPSPAAPAN